MVNRRIRVERFWVLLLVLLSVGCTEVGRDAYSKALHVERGATEAQSREVAGPPTETIKPASELCARAGGSSDVAGPRRLAVRFADVRARFLRRCFVQDRRYRDDRVLGPLPGAPPTLERTLTNCSKGPPPTGDSPVGDLRSDVGTTAGQIPGEIVHLPRQSPTDETERCEHPRDRKQYRWGPDESTAGAK